MIIFDTETTCLYAEEGQIAQLSYIKINKENKIEFAKNFYFTVDYIDSGASAINGLTLKSLQELSNNKKFDDFVDEIYTDFNSDDLLVAHNVSFDKSFLLEEFRRLGKDISNLEDCDKYFCTMEYYTDILQIHHSYYGYKYPKLTEVAKYLGLDDNSLEAETSKIFNIDAEDISYHDARFDVIATYNIYLNCISKEIEKNKRANDIEISEVIEQALNTEHTVVRKAVLLEETNFGRIERYIVFDIQIDDIVADCPNYNIDLIHIDDAKYLMMNYNEDAYIITVENKEYSKSFCDIEECFSICYVLGIEKCPSTVQFPARLYNVKDYKTMIKMPLSHYNNFSSTIVKDTNYNQLIDDSDIPF